jgi:hypothetical protein
MQSSHFSPGKPETEVALARSTAAACNSQLAAVAKTLAQLSAISLAITFGSVPATQAENLMPRFRGCLAIEDGTKERLECYDKLVPPQPRRVTNKPISILECRFAKEEDARLRCYNDFVSTGRWRTRSGSR